MSKSVAKKTDNAILTFARPGDQLDAAGKINYFHRLSIEAGECAIKAALEVGMELYKEKIRRQGTFTSWIEQNCDFSVRTAWKYLALLQKSIGSENDLIQLTDASDKKREAVLNEFSGKVESKTLSELMCDYGIIQKTVSNLGGKREGAGRKPKDDQDLADAAEKISMSAELNKIALDGIITNLYRVGVTEGGFGSLGTDALKVVVTALKDTVRKAEEILKSRETR